MSVRMRTERELRRVPIRKMATAGAMAIVVSMRHRCSAVSEGNGLAKPGTCFAIVHRVPPRILGCSPTYSGGSESGDYGPAPLVHIKESNNVA